MLSSPAVVPVLNEMLLITAPLTGVWLQLLRQILTQFEASSSVAENKTERRKTLGWF